MSILDSLADYECPRCGCSGIHACIGRRLPPPTPEEEAATTKALENIFRDVASEEQKMHTSLQPLINSGILIPAIKDGDVNPALPVELRRTFEAALEEAMPSIVEAIDREILEELNKL